MFSHLKNHPFAVEAFFETSLVLTYAALKEEVAPLIPECLSLDVFENKWAFIAVAIVKTKGLRPNGFPSFMGNDFVLTGYRVFVRYTTSGGKRLRGLYILKSETDKKSMAFLGNVFTHYKYATTDIKFTATNTIIQVESINSNLHLEIKTDKEEVSLPGQSPFKDWKEARRFAGPLPFTFTYSPQNKQVLIIEGIREDWKPKPVEAIKEKIGFIEGLHLNNAVLANAFIINNIPYRWKKGKTDTWKP